ncbi:hypothetical protein [Rubrivirga marina]|nr:hypothetical protein [Rubrivirga marina]
MPYARFPRKLRAADRFRLGGPPVEAGGPNPNAPPRLDPGGA